MECSSGKGAGIIEWCLLVCQAQPGTSAHPELLGVGPAGLRFPHIPIFSCPLTLAIVHPTSDKANLSSHFLKALGQ